MRESMQTERLKEGMRAKTIGIIVIVFSIVSTAICVVAFGQIKVPNSLYGSHTVWSVSLIVVYITSGIGGVLFGYLITKVGSVLVYLAENIDTYIAGPTERGAESEGLSEVVKIGCPSCGIESEYPASKWDVFSSVKLMCKACGHQFRH